MTEHNTPHSASHVLHAMWLNWIIAYGAVTLPLVLAMFVPKLWVAFICLAEGYMLTVVTRSNVTDKFSRCSLLVSLAAKILLTASMVMFVVVILCTDWLVPTVIHLNLYNSEIPFVTCLVILPVSAIYCALAIYLGLGTRACRECQRRNGFYAGDSIVATLYYRESKYQVSIVLLLSVLMGAIEYWYYFARYINSDMNAPDRFFFNIIPALAYFLSIFFMAGRYASMKALVEAMGEKHAGTGNSTEVRYLIFCGDEILLHQSPDGQWDTPADLFISRTHSIGDPEARRLFTEATGIADFHLRYCFTNEGFTAMDNVIHYAAFIDSPEAASTDEKDLWFNAYMLDRGLATNSLAPLLANELYRIHTMTMAWKTYNREGRRLYPIKHYRPTFRLRDLRDWTVDYDDPTWFDIASNNEDRHFFRLRRLWTRLTDLKGVK